MLQHVLILGAGQTAAAAARTLRRRGYDGGVTLVGEEPHRPYQRPPLSKEYLQGEDGRESLFLLGEKWCADNDVELRLGVRATRLDANAREVELADGTRLRGEAVLFATGGRPRRLPGLAGERVHYLRTVEDCESIRALLAPGRRIIVLGGGFLGSEVAASARMLGAEVTLVEMLANPLEAVLGTELGAVCADIHRRHGVDLRTGQAVESVTHCRDGVTVRTTSGAAIDGDALVVGAGIVPNAEVAENAGIEVADGIVVDEHCRAGRDGVYAAGDVANHFHPLFERHLRVEHFDNANKHGAAAAKNILGRETAFDDPHWFWSDLYDLNLQHVGDPQRRKDLVIRGSLEELDFIAFGVEGGVVRSAFAVERGGDLALARELIADRTCVDPAALGDEDTDVAELLPEP